MLQRIALDKIDPNPDQPRKTFDPGSLRELASSILTRGLMQPIVVRPAGNGRYQIVMGERRFRAHQLLAKERKLKPATILAHVRRMDDATRDLQAIVENLMRVDIAPLEEAAAFDRLIASGQFTVESLAKELGSHPHRIKNRLALTKLDPQIVPLVAGGQLGVWAAAIIADLPPEQQCAMVRRISKGQLRTQDEIRAAVAAALDRLQQGELIPAIRTATKAELAVLRSLEARIEQVAKMVAAGFEDGECAAARRVSPDRVMAMAEKLAAIQVHLRDMERQLRRTAAQADILDAA